MATYERLMQAQERVVQARSRAGASNAVIDQALNTSEPATPEALGDEELYLGTLARFVEALGGHLEVTAVFPDGTVPLTPREGGPTRGPGDTGPAQAS